MSDSTINYYWRDYNGDIPKDAIALSSSSNNKYIGQALIIDHGNLIGEIVPGQDTIITSCYGIHKSTIYNKILCSSNANNLKWKTVSNGIKPKCVISLVTGGSQHDKYNLYIGRTSVENNVKLGKVFPHDDGTLELYYVLNNKEESTKDFEILTYSNC